MRRQGRSAGGTRHIWGISLRRPFDMSGLHGSDLGNSVSGEFQVGIQRFQAQFSPSPTSRSCDRPSAAAGRDTVCLAPISYSKKLDESRQVASACTGLFLVSGLGGSVLGVLQSAEEQGDFLPRICDLLGNPYSSVPGNQHSAGSMSDSTS